MDKGFLKFKKKVRSDALIKGAVIGAALGLIVFSVLFLLRKREIIDLKIIFLILFTVGAVAVGFGLTYVLCVPSDKRLARRLDKELALHEKVQTMLAFQDDGAPMKQLQRADTNARLAASAFPKVKLKTLWKYIVAGVLAVATFVTALAIPAKEKEEKQDPVFNITQWQILRMQNLIEYVNSSDMVETAKTYTVDQLEGLILVLGDTTESVKISRVVKVIVDVDGKIDCVNSYATIRNALGETGTKELVYCANAFQALQNSSSVAAFADLRGSFGYSTFTSQVSAFSLNVGIALLDCGYDSTDGLYASIETFVGALEALSEDIENHTEETLDAALNGNGGIGGLFTDFAEDAHTAIARQKINRQVFDYMKAELMEIFSISEDDIPDLGDEELEYQIDGEGDDDKDEVPPQYAGPGSGEKEYGDEILFDPDSGYVNYGEVWNKYEGKMDQLLDDPNLPEEIKEKIEKYFNSL